MPSRRGFVLLFSFLVFAVPSSLYADSSEPAATPSIKVGKDAIEFFLGKNLITRYAIASSVAKPYFYPVNALPGITITRPWPMENVAGEAKDHVHQKSAWFCHGDVIPEGLDYKKHFKNVAGIDFWSEGKGHGKIVCVGVSTPVQAKDHASVTTRNEWRTSEGQKIMDETRTISLYPMEKGSLIVLDIDLSASVYPITFADTKEGSMGVRVRESIRVDRGKGQLVNAEGKTGEGKGANADRKGCWGLVSAWCDYSGPVAEDKIAGIAVFAAPSNPIDSAWHARGYGLLAANPFGREKHAKFPDRKGNNKLVKIEKGKTLKLRYGLYVHPGNAKEGKVAEAFARFSKLGAK